MRTKEFIDIENKKRVCSGKGGCGRILPFDAFSMDKRKGYPLAICKDCRKKFYDSQKAKQFYKENKEKIKKYNLAKYHENKNVLTR